MSKAHSITLKTGGENSIIYLASQDMAEWIANNEQKLSENAAAFDNHLPPKLIYAIGNGNTYNTYFTKTAKYGVPGQSWMDFSYLKRQFISNQHSINLPIMVQDIIDNKNKHKRDKGEDTNPNDLPKRTKN